MWKRCCARALRKCQTAHDRYAHFVTEAPQRAYCHTLDQSGNPLSLEERKGIDILRSPEYGVSEPRLDTLRKLIESDASATRHLLETLQLPEADTAQWVRSFLECPWTFNGENYLSYPIGHAQYSWMLNGNADKLTGTHYVSFCRCFNHTARPKETKHFILSTLAMRHIETMLPDGMSHFLRLLAWRVGNDAVPEGLKKGIARQLTYHWSFFHFPTERLNDHDRVQRFSSYTHCLYAARDMGIDVGSIINESVLKFAQYVDVCHTETMAVWEWYLHAENQAHLVDHAASLEFLRAALQNAGFPQNGKGVFIPRVSKLCAQGVYKLALDPSMVELLMSVFTQLNLGEPNAAFRGILQCTRGQLVQIRSMQHFWSKFRNVWPTQNSMAEDWPVWEKYLLFPLNCPSLHFNAYPLIRILAHCSFAVSSGKKEIIQRYGHIIKWCVESMLVFTDVGTVFEQFQGSGQNTLPLKKSGKSSAIGASLRHIYVNNPKAIQVMYCQSNGLIKSPYMRWITFEQQLELYAFAQMHTSIPVTPLKSIYQSFAAALAQCVQPLSGDFFTFRSFAWPAYLYLRTEGEIVVSHVKHNPSESIQQCLQEQVGALDIDQLLQLLRDAARAGLWNDKLIKSLRSALEALQPKETGIERIWKYCLLHIHVLEEGYSIDLPKSFLFSVLNLWYSAVQKPQQIPHYAKFLPDLVFLVCRLKINRQTMAKLTEICHIMMHYTKDCPRAAVAILEVFARQVLPPTSFGSSEHVISGRILASNRTNVSTWLDKAQVQRFVERYVNELKDSKDAPEAFHRSAAITLFEFCITLRHNSPATDSLIEFARKGNSPALYAEIYRLCLAFSKPMDADVVRMLTGALSQPTHPKQSDGWLCAASDRFTLHSLLPLLSSTIRHGNARHKALLLATLKEVLLQLKDASPAAMRFLLETLRSENSIIGSLIDQRDFLNAQRALLREVHRRVNNRTAPIDLVLEAIQWNIGCAEVSYDAEIHHCLNYVSDFISSAAQDSACEQIVTILQMMARSGWRHDFILRQALPVFLRSPTKNVYTVTAVLSALRKLEIQEVWSRDESIELLVALCTKLRPMTALSGRLVASVLTSFSVFIQSAVGNDSTVQSAIEGLFAQYAPILSAEAPAMDCITVSASLIACTRLGLSNRMSVVGALLDRAADLAWAKFPAQTVHLLHATAQIEPTHDILLYLLFSEEIALAIRCALDQASSYKNLHDALERIRSANPTLSLYGSPVAGLVYERIPEDTYCTEQSEPGMAMGEE